MTHTTPRLKRTQYYSQGTWGRAGHGPDESWLCEGVLGDYFDIPPNTKAIWLEVSLTTMPEAQKFWACADAGIVLWWGETAKSRATWQDAFPALRDWGLKHFPQIKKKPTKLYVRVLYEE